MNTKTLSAKAISTINQYENFRIGKAICSVPYFNNKVTNSRVAIRTFIGKGNPKDIYEEVMAIIIKRHVDQGLLTNDSLKKLLVENNIGIDCSGLVYHILDSELKELKKNPLNKKINFINSTGLFGKIRSKMRPAENCDVKTFADNTNSTKIDLKDVAPGNIITMIGGPDANDRDHILLIYQVEYQDSIPTKIFYTHAIAYPTDGLYGTGIKKGTIEIIDSSKNILDQKWFESDKSGDENPLFLRAQKSNTELRKIDL